MEPGWRNCRQTLTLCNLLQHASICVTVGHVVPCHVDRIILGNTGKFLLFEISGYRLGLFILQVFVPDVSDKSVLRADLLPVLLALYDRNFVLFRYFGKDRTLDSALIANLSVSFIVATVVFPQSLTIMTLLGLS